MIDTIICGDCLEVMPTLEDKSVDMILADLPYGVTACKWDTPIDLDALWVNWLRVCEGAIVLTGTQPFVTTVINSNPGLFKYELIWDKQNGKAPGIAKYRPMPSHETILIFGAGKLRYNPQFTTGPPYRDIHIKQYAPRDKGVYPGGYKGKYININEGKRHPLSVIHLPTYSKPGRFPTQKPVALFEYLIRTYTNDGDTVLDPTCGSGTTAVACKRTDRHYICIEKEPEYCAIAEKRLAEML